eukprot:c2002_g1_i2.p1 GENE.c2002_g1_i2~~c2002_g1_i2.p1  ORF type:complete len:202 (-),score=30.26 c2002_g1_i2:208-813(-)
MRNIFRKFDRLAREHQMFTSCATAGVCCGVGDVVAQKMVERDEKMDWHRTLICATWGMFFVAPFQTKLYGYWDRIWGELPKAKAKKVVLDCFIVPLGVFPAFYTYKGLMSGTPTNEIFADINERLGHTMLANCVFWLPASTLNFTVIPPHMRVNFMFSWEVVWAVLFSYFCFSDPAFAGDEDKRKRQAPNLVTSQNNSHPS